jgi:hypothetical protein
MDLLFAIFCFGIFTCNSSMYRIYLSQIQSTQLVVIFLLINVLFSSAGKIYGTFIRQMPMRLICYFFVLQNVISCAMLFQYRPLTVILFTLASMCYGAQSSIIFGLMDKATDHWNIYRYRWPILQFGLLIFASSMTSWLLVSRIYSFLPIMVSGVCAIYFFYKSQNEKFNMKDILDDDYDRMYDFKFILTSTVINFIANAVMFIINTEAYLWYILQIQFFITLSVINGLMLVFALLSIHTDFFVDVRESIYLNSIYLITFINKNIEYSDINKQLTDVRAKLMKRYIYNVAGDVFVFGKYREGIKNRDWKVKIVGYLSNIFI